VTELAYPRRGLHGRTLDQLGRHIVAGRWPPGTPLPNEDELTAELGVSRTVVRESIKVLQAKGLLEVRPRTGTRVRPRRAWHVLDADVANWVFEGMAGGGGDLDDLRELHEVRATIETAAARLAAERRTEAELAEIEANERRVEAAWAEPIAHRTADLDFHASIVEAAHNGLLSHVNALIRVALEATDTTFKGNGDEAREATARRADLARAVRAGDAAAAEAAMSALVEHDWQRLVKGRS
jgi:DNA-binding FadR family transcriptional regulator